MAGYAVRRAALPRLHREQGFVVELAMKVEAERHVREDRAGVSVTILDEELRGIELGFWEDTVFAQEGGASLFVHAEEAGIDTRPMTVWRIEVRGDRYRLFAGERAVLVGALRDYRAWKPPLPSFPDAYEQPSSVVVSDNTTSAAARFVLRSLVVTPL
jgi:hypothetical protein